MQSGRVTKCGMCRVGGPPSVVCAEWEDNHCGVCRMGGPPNVVCGGCEVDKDFFVKVYCHNNLQVLALMTGFNEV